MRITLLIPVASRIHGARIARVSMLTVLGGGVFLQSPATLPAQTQPGAWVVEHEVRDRWLFPGQPARFTPYRSSVASIHVDSIRAGAAETHVWLRLPAYFDRATLTVGRDGRLVRAELIPPASTYRPPTARDSVMQASFRLLDGLTRLTLPEWRVGELIPSFRPSRAEQGARWVDTVRLEAAREGNHQRLSGTRVSVIVGDTTVGGRRLWIVRDSARVTYDERWLERERTLDTTVPNDRVVDGTIVGRHLHDPALGISWDRIDTTRLVGAATLRYPDGRTFRSPVRYERVRRWVTRDRVGYAARQDSVRAERGRGFGGVVRVPIGALEERLARGDRPLQDSLFALLRATQSADSVAVLMQLLRLSARDAELQRRIVEWRVTSGDSLLVLSELEDAGYRLGRPMSESAMRQALRYMADPGIAFRLGGSRDPLYENIVQGLTTRPPAITPDTSRWTCEPNACRLLAAQWTEAREPRLRAVGLVARAMLDPAGWADTLVAHADSAIPYLQRAVHLARGVGATWPAASQRPIPTGSDWRDWLEWMNGRNPAYPPLRIAGQPVATGTAVRFEETHANAIRYVTASSGRDVVGELRGALARAESDSAHLVFGTMLVELDAYEAPPAEVAALFRRSAAHADLGLRLVLRLFGCSPRGLCGQPAAPLADSATTAAITDRLIGVTLAREPEWPTIQEKTGRPPPRAGINPAGESSANGLLEDANLPRGARDRWRSRVRIISRSEWDAMPVRAEGMLYTLSTVWRVGPFAHVTINYAGRVGRTPEQGPHLYYGGRSYYLMELDGEWVVVSRSEWIT